MRVEIDIKKAIELYRDQGLPSTKVSKIVGCSVATLISRLRENGVEIRSCGNHQEKVPFETMKQEYESGMSTSSIAKKYNMSSSSIFQRLKKGGVQMRDREEEAAKANTKIPEEEHGNILYQYKNEAVTCSDIAKEYDVHKSTIAAILKKHGVKPDEIQGPRHHNWKGGITPLHNKIRNCEKAQEWKRACMERDDYTCQITKQRGEKLHVHHKKPFSTILKEFLDSGRNTLEEALEYKPFWDIKNGIVISEEAHLKLHSHQIDQDLLSIVTSLLSSGYSINKIANITRRDWHTIKRIIGKHCV